MTDNNLPVSEEVNVDMGAPLLVVNAGRILSLLEDVIVCEMFSLIPIMNSKIEWRGTVVFN